MSRDFQGLIPKQQFSHRCFAPTWTHPVTQCPTRCSRPRAPLLCRPSFPPRPRSSWLTCSLPADFRSSRPPASSPPSGFHRSVCSSLHRPACCFHNETRSRWLKGKTAPSGETPVLGFDTRWQTRLTWWRASPGNQGCLTQSSPPTSKVSKLLWVVQLPAALKYYYPKWRLRWFFRCSVGRDRPANPGDTQ